MSDRNTHSQTEYLDRAQKLRATAAEVRDLRVMEALISSAEAYERMATWLVDDGQKCSMNDGTIALCTTRNL